MKHKFFEGTATVGDKMANWYDTIVWFVLWQPCLTSSVYFNDLKSFVKAFWYQCRPNICHEYHELYSWRKIVMWSFPCKTIKGKLKISPHVEKFQYKWWGFIAIYAVLLQNLLIRLICSEIFAKIYALSCGKKLSPNVHLWRKNDKYQVWRPLLGLADSLPPLAIHILNRLDMRIHLLAFKIYHTY